MMGLYAPVQQVPPLLGQSRLFGVPKNEGRDAMPKIKANNITINYEQQGTGEPLLLIPYLAADNACYAFQVEDYAKQFTCISLDPRGAGESDKPAGAYSTELLADDIAAFIAAIGVDRVHVAGLSLGAARRQTSRAGEIVVAPHHVGKI